MQLQQQLSSDKIRRLKLLVRKTPQKIYSETIEKIRGTNMPGMKLLYESRFGKDRLVGLECGKDLYASMLFKGAIVFCLMTASKELGYVELNLNQIIKKHEYANF